MIVTRLRPPVRRWEATFEELDRIRRQMEAYAEAVGGPARLQYFGAFPATNLSYDADNFYVRMELPGVDPNDLVVSAMDRSVSVTGRRQLPREEEGVSYHRREREGGEFSRNVELPTDFDRDEVEASYTNGVLTIRLPRLAAAKPRPIAVRSS